MWGTGRQYHIDCAQGDVGRYVILAGDPGRIPHIAERFDGAKQVAYNREFNVWTGTLLGEKVTACSTGIGAPSTAIAVEELYRIGADTFIRTGTCGGIAIDVCAGDVVIATGAVRFEHTSLEYAPIEYPAVPDLDVTAALRSAALRLGLRAPAGVVQCKDSFYGQHEPDSMPVSHELKEKWEAWKRLGVLASEMESSALFVIGAARKCRTGACFLVMRNQERVARGMDMAQTDDVSGAIDTAVEAMKEIIRRDRGEI